MDMENSYERKNIYCKRAYLFKEKVNLQRQGKQELMQKIYYMIGKQKI